MIDRALFLSSDGLTFDGKRAVPNEAVTKSMLSLADLQPGEKVLEIGTGSGYQTACMIGTGAIIVSVDPVNGWFGGNNQTRIADHPNRPCGVDYITGDGRNGDCGGPWSLAPYDCIFVTCGMTSIPPAYEEQLREGGRLIIPLGKPDGQELLRLEKRNGKLVMGRCAGYVRFQMCS